MKKYAALRLYYAPDKYQGQSVVTLNEQGEVLSFFSLDEETHTTEWVGGIIILSSKATISIEENYNDLLTEEHYTELCEATGTPQIGDLLMPSICPDGRIWVVNTDKPFSFAL